LPGPATIDGREVNVVELSVEWEAPEFEEIGVAPEITMYVARRED
jgi:coenzyme PQQ precursor peptide PqqA